MLIAQLSNSKNACDFSIWAFSARTVVCFKFITETAFLWCMWPSKGNQKINQGFYSSASRDCNPSLTPSLNSRYNYIKKLQCGRLWLILIWSCDNLGANCITCLGPLFVVLDFGPFWDACPASKDAGQAYLLTLDHYLLSQTFYLNFSVFHCYPHPVFMEGTVFTL